MAKHIMNILVLPLLLPSLRPVDKRTTISPLGEAGSLKRAAEGAGSESDNSAAPPSSSEARDCRKALLPYLLCNDDKLVMASLCLSVSFLQNEALDESLLDALGILPRRKRHKKLLLQQLIGDNSESHLDRLFSPSLDRPHDDIMSENWENHLGHELLSGSTSLKHRSQMLEAVIQLMCRRPPPYAEVLWQAGWLLRQLLPYQEHKISDPHMSMLNDAYAAAQQEFSRELTDFWSDIIPAVIADEWKVCRKALDTPMLQRDASLVLLPSTQATTGENPPPISSIHVRERMRESVKILMVLYQMQVLLMEGTLSERPLLVELPEEGRDQQQISSATVGTEVDILKDAMPCTVAFERGKERQVYLVLLGGTSGSLLLVEEISLEQSRGVIRVTAPLAGSDPRVDEKHTAWLNLRIRSPHQPSADVGRLGPPRIGSKG